MATASKVLTYEEWLKMPEVEGIEEVVDGEVHILPPAKSTHAYIVENLLDELKPHLKRRATRVLTGSFGLVIRHDPLITRIPDIAVFHKDRAVEVDGYFHSAPELLVEVLSRANTRREQARKLQDYESFGVPEVWIVSPEARTVEILQLNDGKLTTTAIVNSGELRPKLFPEAAVDVAAIWED